MVPNSPELNPVKVFILGALKAKVYSGQPITTLDETRTVILDEWEVFPDDPKNSVIESFKLCLKKKMREMGDIYTTIMSYLSYIVNVKHDTKSNESHFYFSKN